MVLIWNPDPYPSDYSSVPIYYRVRIFVLAETLEIMLLVS